MFSKSKILSFEEMKKITEEAIELRKKFDKLFLGMERFNDADLRKKLL